MFDKLCHQAKEAGLPEEAIKHIVFDVLRRQDMGFFHYIFLKDDGGIDPEERELLNHLLILCHATQVFEIDQRFAPFAFA